ncbi:hypothetical protein SDC9_198907 [bioreactor metagenome]|uniref:Uncharacterized protein n=1 Tax=bioreactor metagenome TaxID=1076179 RepID=A0A645IS94_9ZZZZ
MTGQRLRPRRILGNKAARGGHIVIQPAVFPGVNHVSAAAQHADDQAAGPEGALRRHGVDAPGQSRDHQRSGLRKAKGQILRAADAVRRSLPRPHHGDGGQLVHRGKPAPDVHKTGRVVNTA